MKRSWLEQLAEHFEKMPLAKQAGTIAIASIFSTATVALMVPESNLGRMLRADVVESPPSFTLNIDEDEEDGDEEVNEEPPGIEISTGEASLATDDDDADAPCTDDELQSDDSELCIDGEFVLCEDETEGETNSDESYICSEGEWIENDDADAPADEDLIEILDHSANPEPFNPVTEELDIEFELSADAIIELTINNISDEELMTLIDDEDLDEGDNAVSWTGTDDNSSSGTIFPAGVYTYKIKAKNTETQVTEDTEEGSITIVFESVGDDPEDESSTSSSDSSDDGEVEDEDTDLATQVMTNTTEGETSATGPSVLIYAIVPLIGYFFTKRRRSE